MGSLGTKFVLFIALAVSCAQIFAADATQGTSGEPSHEGEEDTAKKDSEKSEDPDEDLTAELDSLIEDSNENPDDQPTVLLDKKEAIENRIAQLKEALLKEDDPTKKAALEKKIDKLAKAAEKIANVLTARSNANIDRLQAAAKKPEAPKPAPVASTAPVPMTDSTHLKGPQISASANPSGSRSIPISNEGSGNRSYAYSDRTNGGAVAPRTSVPKGKSSVPQRVPAPIASNSVPTPSAAAATESTTGSATPSAPYVASSTSVGSSPIVSAPSRMPASSPVLASVEMPKLTAPALVDAPTSGTAPISRSQAESAGVTVAATPQARLANNLVAASVESSSREFSRGVTRKNEIGSTKNLYPSIAGGTNNAEAPKAVSLTNAEIYDKSPAYDSKPAANTFYGKTSSARAQGQYIVLGNQGEEGDAPELPTPANVTAVAVAESVPAISEKATGPAKLVRAAFKPVPTYNSPTVKDPIVEKSKTPSDALASKKLDFKNFRENPFL